jgi:hypothetical protein
MADYTKYQQKIIKNYYEHADTIGLQKLGELVTNLYLAEGKQRARYWKNAVSAMEKLKVPQSRIDHLLKSDDPALLAKLLEELLAKNK